MNFFLSVVSLFDCVRVCDAICFYYWWWFFFFLSVIVHLRFHSVCNSLCATKGRKIRANCTMLAQMMMMMMIVIGVGIGIGIDMNVSNRKIITYHALIDLIRNNSKIHNFNFCAHIYAHERIRNDVTHKCPCVCVRCQLKQTSIGNYQPNAVKWNHNHCKSAVYSNN